MIILLRRDKGLAVFIALIMFYLLSSVETFGASVTDQLNIQLTVPPWLKYEIIKESSVVKITKGDIKKGYKDVKSGNIILISTNITSGYVLSLQCTTGGFFTSVTVTTENGSYVLSPDSMLEIYEPYEGLPTVTKKVDYRFYLFPDLVADVYPWPIGLTVYPF